MRGPPNCHLADSVAALNTLLAHADELEASARLRQRLQALGQQGLALYKGKHQRQQCAVLVQELEGQPVVGRSSRHCIGMTCVVLLQRQPDAIPRDSFIWVRKHSQLERYHVHEAHLKLDHLCELGAASIEVGEDHVPVRVVCQANNRGQELCQGLLVPGVAYLPVSARCCEWGLAPLHWAVV
eukprot:327648-Lingulodinium_polyedra.AAC.1